MLDETLVTPMVLCHDAVVEPFREPRARLRGDLRVATERLSR